MVSITTLKKPVYTFLVSTLVANLAINI